MKERTGKRIDPATGEPALPHDQHAPELSRRAVVRGGMQASAAIWTMPSLLGSLWSRRALGANECGADPLPGLLPFMVFDMKGGASLPGNFLVGKAGGPKDLLKSYDLLGWDPRAAGALDESFGLPMAAKSSKLLKGILDTASPDARALLRFGSFCHFGQDDTSSNPLSAITLAAKAGVRGTVLPKGLGTVNSDSGGNSDPIYVDATVRPLLVSRTTDILGAVSFGEAFDGLRPDALAAAVKGARELSALQAPHYADIEGGTRFAALADCGYQKNLTYTQGAKDLDARLDPIFQGIYNVAGAANDSPDAISASIVMNVLKGSSGPGALTVTDCDYHDGTQATGDDRDYAMGKEIGRAVEAAHQLKKPLFFQLITDGGVAATQGTRIWTNESGDRSMSVVGYYKPDAAPVLRPNVQIGCYNDGQSADRTTFIGFDASKAAYAAFANYMFVNGKIGQFSALLKDITGADVFTPAEIDAFLVFG